MGSLSEVEGVEGCEVDAPQAEDGWWPHVRSITCKKRAGLSLSGGGWWWTVVHVARGAIGVAGGCRVGVGGIQDPHRH